MVEIKSIRGPVSSNGGTVNWFWELSSLSARRTKQGHETVNHGRRLAGGLARLTGRGVSCSICHERSLAGVVTK